MKSGDCDIVFNTLSPKSRDISIVCTMQIVHCILYSVQCIYCCTVVAISIVVSSFKCFEKAASSLKRPNKDLYCLFTLLLMSISLHNVYSFFPFIFLLFLISSPFLFCCTTCACRYVNIVLVPTLFGYLVLPNHI